MKAISSLLIVTALLPVASAQDTRIIEKKDVVYAETASPLHTLDVYASPSAMNAPVVFWIHGGGWQGATKATWRRSHGSLWRRGLSSYR
jgi:acetyl esterase/lipase